jgi:hypothetical protein
MMRRRFGRRRWGGGGSEGEGPRGLDPARELARVIQAGLVPTDALEPVTDEQTAPLAAVGTGVSRDGEPLVVGVSPTSGGDAWLAALAVAARRLEEEGEASSVLALSPSWPLAARRRLGLLRPGLLRVRALAEPSSAVGEREVAAEPPEPPLVAAASLTVSLHEPMASLFQRASTALEGLAAKHGGALRVAAAGLELVFYGRPVAVLRADPAGVVLEAWEPRREHLRLEAGSLSDALDRLEGSLRKVLSDRRIREGEGGLRASLAERLAETLGVRARRSWPLAGPLGEAIDFVGSDGEGRALIGAARGELGLVALGPLLDAWTALAPRATALLGTAVGPAAPRLVVASEHVDPAVERVLGCLDLEVRLWSADAGRRHAGLVARPAPERLAAGAPRAARAMERPREPEPRREPTPARAGEEPSRDVRPGGDTGEGEARHRFEEFSLFDLAEPGSEEAGSGTRRRRRRRRGRGRGRGGFEGGGSRVDADGEREEEEAEPEAAEPEHSVHARELPPRGERRGRRGRGRGARASRPREEGPGVEPRAVEADEEDVEEQIELAEIPEVEEPAPAAEATFEDEEEPDEEESPEEARLREEREARRRARIAKSEPEAAPPPPRPPRRRAAFLAHADRESIAAAVLLARETRLVEGIWIYPQSDLMTFFRSVATDLREETPICVIGFVARPVRETLQAASLYRDRLTWFDHHEWPPEDLGALRGAIGTESVHVESGAGAVLPVVLAHCTRRSRFSDKLVDLLTGGFSRHDYERWGRLWWWRLGQLVSKPGERRADLDALITGRPSDLAREASHAAPPPPPAEAEWVAARDFRLVHFGGYSLVRVPVPLDLDVHLVARIARERYAAELSLAWHEGTELFVLGADEVAAGRRALDLAAMVDHLAEKFAYATGLSDADHVARFRISGAVTSPERVDEVVGEIAMGRSILEG